MGENMAGFVRRASFAVLANVAALVIATLVTVLVPKFIAVNQYGYWQLYLFITSYTGVLHFGWVDGIYLVMGGQRYGSLDGPGLSAQFRLLAALQCLMTCLLVVSILCSMGESPHRTIWLYAAIALPLTNLRLFWTSVLLLTNRIREASEILIVDRVLLGAVTLGVILLGANKFELLLAADVVAKVVTLLMAGYLCADLLRAKPSPLRESSKQAWRFIKVGANLLVSNLAAMLILGVVRFGVDRTWDIVTFGRVSLALSVSSLALMLIGAVGSVVFPALRRVQPNRLAPVFNSASDVLGSLLLGALLLFFPGRELLRVWLPQYTESLSYMALILPIAFFESRMSVIVNPYLNALRRERFMLLNNVVILVLSVLFTGFATQIAHDLDLVIISIPVLSALRFVLAESFLSRLLGVRVVGRMLVEFLVLGVFVVTANSRTWLIGAILYAVCFAGFMVLRRNDIRESLRYLKA